MGTGYLGIGEVDVDVAGDRFYIIIAGDQGQRTGDRDVDELVEGHLGPVDRRISELGSQERVRVARRRGR